MHWRFYSRFIDVLFIILAAASFWSYLGGRPLALLIIVYYRALYTGLSPLRTVLLGFLDDALHGTPVGVSAGFYLLLQVILERNRPHLEVNEPFLCWLEFIALSLFSFFWYNVTSVLITVCMFPLYVCVVQKYEDRSTIKH